jgi:DNA replication protein DnaC
VRKPWEWHRAPAQVLDEIEHWDRTAKVKLDWQLVNELASLRFLEAQRNVVIVGPVGVGKTFLAHAFGHAACRRGFSVTALRADKMLKTLKHARLDNSYDIELRKLVAIDLLIVDDFGLDAMDATESRDAFEVLVERHRSGSMIVTSNRGPDEWLATFADPVRAQAAIDRFTSNAYDFAIDGESYRQRLKKKLASGSPGQKGAAARN